METIPKTPESQSSPELAETSGTLRKKPMRSLTTAWVEGGTDDRPILMFLHGFPDSPVVWEFQCEAFRERYTILCPFARGVGPSAVSRNREGRGRYALNSQSLDLLEILATVDPDRSRPVILIGHDLGAVRAWHVAGLLGPRLKGLVTMGGLSLEQAARRLGNTEQFVASWYVFLFQLPLLPESILSLMPKRFIERAYRSGGLTPSLWPKVELTAEELRHGVDEYRSLLREMPRTFLNGALRPRLDVPVLCMFGKSDPFVLPPSRDELATSAAEVSVRILDSGHWMQREKSLEVNEILSGFFSRVLLKDQTGEPVKRAPTARRAKEEVAPNAE